MPTSRDQHPLKMTNSWVFVKWVVAIASAGPPIPMLNNFVNPFVISMILLLVRQVPHCARIATVTANNSRCLVNKGSYSNNSSGSYNGNGNNGHSFFAIPIWTSSHFGTLLPAKNGKDRFSKATMYKENIVVSSQRCELQPNNLRHK